MLFELITGTGTGTSEKDEEEESFYDLVISKENPLIKEENIDLLRENKFYVKIEWWNDENWFGDILCNALTMLYILGKRRNIDIFIKIYIVNPVILCDEFFNCPIKILNSFKQCKFVHHPMDTKNLTELDSAFSEDIQQQTKPLKSSLIISSKDKFTIKHPQYTNMTKDTIKDDQQYDLVIVKGLIDGRELKPYTNEDIKRFFSISKGKIIIISNKNEINSLRMRLCLPIYHQKNIDNKHNNSHHNHQYLSTEKELNLFALLNSLSNGEKTKIKNSLNPFHRRMNSFDEILKDLIAHLPQREKIINCPYKKALSVKNIEDGIYTLMIKYLNRDTKWESSFSMLREGERWSKKLFNSLWKKERKDDSHVYNFLKLSSSLWTGISINSKSKLQIIKGIGPKYAISLQNFLEKNERGIESLRGVEIDKILNRNPPFGFRIKEEILKLPFCSLEIRDLRNGKITIEYSISLRDCRSAELWVQGICQLQTQTIYHEEVTKDTLKRKEIYFPSLKFTNLNIFILSKWSIAIDLLKSIEFEPMHQGEEEEECNDEAINKDSQCIISKIKKNLPKKVKTLKISEPPKKDHLLKGKVIRGDGCDNVFEVFIN